MTKQLVGTANLLAGQAVALAEAFLDVRTDPPIERANFLYEDLRRLRGMQIDLPTSSIVDAAFMLMIALRNAGRSAIDFGGPLSARSERWRSAVASLAEHVRKESIALNDEGHFA